MLKRQRVIIELLRQVNRSISHTELVKYAFLLSQETVLSKERTFYDFVPHQYGPFSFALYREMSALTRDNLVVETETSVRLTEEESQPSTALSIPNSWRDAVQRIVSQYGSYSSKELLYSIYSRYPWFSLNSKLDQIAKNRPAFPTASISVYTTGYEGKSVDGFFNQLLVNGMKVIIDVRANPISRKYGFARKSMSEIAGRLGIEYFHIPLLGISSKRRENLSDYSSYQILLDHYESNTLPNQTLAVNQAVEILADRPSTLVCMENDVRCCHRGRLANVISKSTGIPVDHL